MPRLSQRTIVGLVPFSNSLICFGGCFLYDSILSFQSYLIGEPCKNDSEASGPQQSQNCCTECLGFNPFEYNLLIGLPLASSLITGFIAGYIIDRYGFRLFTIISTSLPVLGAVVRALGTRQGQSHAVSYALMLVGGLIVDNAFTIFYIIQLYVCTRWFSGRYLSFSIGLCLSVSLMGSLIAYYLNVPLALAIGLENAFWVGAIISSITIIVVIILVGADWLGEKYGYDMVTQRSPPDFSLKSLRSFDIRYWLLSFIIGLSCLLFYAFIGNSVGMQNDIYNIDPENAAFASGIMYIVKVIFSPIAGAIGEKADIQGIVGLFGCLCSISGLTLLSLAIGPPIITIVLMGFGFASTYVAMASVLPDLVPFEKLATANGIMNALLCIDVGLADIIIGIITNSASIRMLGWLSSASFLLVVAVLQTCVTIWLIVVDSRSIKRVLFRGKINGSSKAVEIANEKLPLLSKQKL